MMKQIDFVWELERQYFQWLVSLVRGQNYIFLLEYLHNQPFSWVLDRDENRALDGLELREKFTSEFVILTEDSRVFTDERCSVLEVIVALSVRMNDIVIDIEEEDFIDELFWELLSNLDLSRFTDDVWSEDTRFIDDILDVWQNRRFEKDGTGSLFPLKNRVENQQNVEMWYQMNYYLTENYVTLL